MIVQDRSPARPEGPFEVSEIGEWYPHYRFLPGTASRLGFFAASGTMSRTASWYENRK